MILLIQLRVTGDLGLSADYFNLKLAQWEPLIEAWTATLSVAMEPARAGSHKLIQSILVHSEAPLRVNFTEVFYDTIQKAMQVVQESDGDTVNKRILPVYFVNETGLEVRYWVGLGEAHRVCRGWCLCARRCFECRWMWLERVRPL